MTFHCLGCGRPISVDTPEGEEVINLSCTFCGALAPILVNEESGGVAPPASLLRILTLGGTPEMHLEYYLGYSDHQSLLRQGLESRLRKCGLTSQKDCTEEKCRQEYAERVAEVGRRARIAEVGEP